MDMAERSSFKMFITPDDFAKKVNPGEGLKPLLEEVVAVVSPRDISRLYATSGNG